MVSHTILFLATLAISCTLFLLTLQYPFYYYIPGFIRTLTRPARSHREIQWSSPDISVAYDETLPNIVFIIADDLGYNDLSYGSPGVGTPNIDSIAGSGAKFIGAYAGHATCSPARASIFTGRFPSRIGFENTAVPKLFSWLLTRPTTKSPVQPIFHANVYDKVPSYDKMILPVNEVLIPQVLKQANYSTGYVGKIEHF